MDSISWAPHVLPEPCHRSLPSSCIHGCSFLSKNFKRKRLHSMASFNFESDTQRLTVYGRDLIHFIQNEAATVAKFFPSQLENTLEEMANKIPPFSFDISMTAIVGSIASYLLTSFLIDKKVKIPNNGTDSYSEECFLVTCSTPFNRFVLMRCQCIEFRDSDFYESLSTENRHYVKLQRNDADYVKSGHKWVSRGSVDSVNGILTGYQRTYVHTRDGGIVAIDWPSCLDLAGNNGLDTTFLLIAGTAEGSRDKRLQTFVQRSLRSGYFPIVMNPRGCGGSPLITPRMFTAGDSSDVQTAVEFILRSRPWSTIMAVGWGYGANMLVKYLGEEAAATPVTAAVCFNNPFDLEESTKVASDYFSAEFDQEMTKGLVQILKENQLVFEGRKNKFDVKKALSAKSVRGFDMIISRVSKGFLNMQDFYEKSSSKSWIDKVRIPTLCIQDNTVVKKSFLIPHHVFEENPYTTLLLSLSRTQKSNWGKREQQLSKIDVDSLMIEWLSAVELAFLKGRHPLLEETGVTFKLPKEWGLSSQQSLSSMNSGSLVRSMNREQLNKEKNPVDTHQRLSNWDSEKFGLSQNGVVNASKVMNHVEFDIEKSEGEAGGRNVERSQLEWAAESVLEILDVTMQGTFSGKMKEEVLEAVGKGETIVSALQAACPADAREKIMMSLCAALQARGISLKLAGFGENIPAPRISESTIKEIQENFSSVQDRVPASCTNRVAQSHFSETSEDAIICSTRNEAEGSSHSGESSGNIPSMKTSENTPENSIPQNAVLLQHSTIEHKDQFEVHQGDSSFIQMNAKGIVNGSAQDGNEEKQNVSVKMDDLTQDHVNPQEDEGRGKVVQNSASLSVGVSQALGILTNVDDSTQMAVTNVFEVIENVIDELEKEQQQEEQGKQSQDEKHQARDLPNNEENIEKESNMHIYAEDGIISPCKIITNDKKKDLRDLESYGKTISMPTMSNSFFNKRNEYGSINQIILNYYRDVSDSELVEKSKAFGMLPADVAMEYFEDENVWKFINRNLDSSAVDEIQHTEGRTEITVDRKKDKEHAGEINPDRCRKMNSRFAEAIEPTYILMDNEVEVAEVRRCVDSVLHGDGNNEHPKLCPKSSTEGQRFKECTRTVSPSQKNKVKDAVIQSIQLELLRRLGESDVKILGIALSEDVMKIGLAVAQSMSYGIERTQAGMNSEETLSQMKGIGEAPELHVETIISAINNAYGSCIILPRLMPVGSISRLVLEQLNMLYMVNTDNNYDSDQAYRENFISNGDRLCLESSSGGHLNNTGNGNAEVGHSQAQHNNLTNTLSTNETSDLKFESKQDILQDENTPYRKTADINPKVMNAMAMAMGSATVSAAQKRRNENVEDAKQDKSKVTDQGTEISTGRENPRPDSDDNTSSIVCALAEKAMTIAAPVVPVTEDGEVDHDKLVVVLAELGQKGGIWRYIGKVALLWSGLRGAMSLTDRLLGFLNISDRPLHQRLFSFVVMALLLWSPVLVPLLPTLLQQWASQSYTGATSNVALMGLYGAIVILIAIWGRKIRGYDDPLGQYGVKLQPLSGTVQLQFLASGYVLGLCPIIVIHIVSIFSGYEIFSWDPSICVHGSRSFLWNVISSLRMFKLILECLGICLTISFVEELVFRSWLQDEIAADLGFHKATLLSGLSFAVFHWYFPAIPGLWLLSLALIGIKMKCNGNLVSGIGIHAGLLAGIRFINKAGKLKYAMNAPIWLFGTRVGDPLTGLVGISMLCVLVLVLYPWDYKSRSEKVCSTSE